MRHSSIARFRGYRFCDDGTVLSSWQPAGMGHGMKIGPQWKKLRPDIRRGYMSLILSLGNGETERIAVHLAIAEAFMGRKPDPEMDCCHNDGNRLNNALLNLRYASKADNCADKRRHGTMYDGERHHSAKLTAEKVLSIRRLYGTKTIPEIAEEFGIRVRSVYHVINRDTWKHI